MPSNVSPTEILEDNLATALRIVVMRLRRRLLGETLVEGVSISQIAALSRLDKFGPLSPSTLANHERVQPPSMTRVIAALERKKLVEREAHPTDRRVSLIVITPAGQELLTEERRRRDEWLARMLDTLDPKEREALKRAVPILDRISSL